MGHKLAGLFKIAGLRHYPPLLCTVFIAISCGCGPNKDWHLHEISGHLPDLQFSLNAGADQTVTEHSFQGYMVLLYFGFTNCRTECPSTLFRLAKILHELGENASHTRIVFITLDPKRDTPAIMQAYLSAFDAGHTLGLTGSDTELESLAKRYRIAYRLGTAETDDIVHSSLVYVFDPQGHARLLITPNDDIATTAADLQHLLELSS